MNYLVDTDVLISYLNQKEPFLRLVEKLLVETSVVISVVTISEARSGWTEERSAFYLPKLYDLLKIEVVTAAIAEKAGALRHEYKRKGQQLSLADTLIAATAVEKEYILVTNNKKDYPMPDLMLYQRGAS